jgi:ADP-ribose pyrophosphatase YjhB (NUDIX family)
MKRKIKAYGICLYKVENINNKSIIKILLCKSVFSLNKWGCLKGVQDKNESKKQTAKREFFEESTLKVSSLDFEQYFEQINKEKDIGIYLVNINAVKNIETFFIKDTLKKNFLSWENNKVKFFDIKKLPKIKKKQSQLIIEIINFLQNKN